MTVDVRTAAARQARLDAKSVVPEGPYCYSRTEDPVYDAERAAKGEPFVPGRHVTCPHWERRADKPAQANGYCRLLEAGDWMPIPHGTMLLWDQVKECGVNPGEED